MSGARAQSPSQRNPDVSNKSLITKSTPAIDADAFKNQSVSAATAALHKLADDYYAWRNENYPVAQQRRRTPHLGRSADGLFAGENRRARAARAEAARTSSGDEDRQLAEGRTDRLDAVSLATGRRRFWQSRSEIRAHQSAGLCRRMHQRHLFAAEKGIRHAAQTRARRHRASQADAGVLEARAEQSAETGKTLRATRDRSGALDRSAFQRQPDDAGRGSVAGRARRTR